MGTDVEAQRDIRFMLYRSTREQVVEAIQVQEAMDVPTVGGILRAEAGDWLILDQRVQAETLQSQNGTQKSDNLFYSRAGQLLPC